MLRTIDYDRVRTFPGCIYLAVFIALVRSLHTWKCKCKGLLLQILPSAIILSGILMLPQAAMALGSDDAWNGPHNIDCGQCHDLRGASYPKFVAKLCQSCHFDGGPAPGVDTHSSRTTSIDYGNWDLDCWSCHNPHTQEQNLEWGSTYGKYIKKNFTSFFGGPTAIKEINPADPGPYYTPIGTIREITSGMVEYKGNTEYVDNDGLTADDICQVCHENTSNYGSGAIDSHTDYGPDSQPGGDCKVCHQHEKGFRAWIDHLATGVVVPLIACTGVCHDGADPIVNVHSDNCGLCHVNPKGGGTLIEPYETNSPSGGNCADCHSGVVGNHDEVPHTATPGSGAVVIFEDNWHDDAGWSGPKPYFDVAVNCVGCHTTGLKAVHAQNYSVNCSTCHPSPKDSFATWNGSCQQGGCHAVYHEESTIGHIPFEDPYDPGNDCNRCHDAGWNVTQASCSYCHASPGAGPLVTTTDAKASYNGAAKINFITKAGGKVGIGITFYQLDGGPVESGSSVVVSAQGAHTLEFWSVDQSGRVETPHKTANFAIIEDTTPPVTTSNAQASYYQYALITFNATDASDPGVKATYYILDGGPTQTGTSVYVPGVSGTVAHTLQFWSEDWSGNVETPHPANFTITAGTGTFRFNSGSLPTNEYWVDWEVWRGSPSGAADYIVSRVGPCAAPCADDLVVPVIGQQYYVRVSWGNPTEPYDEYNYGYYTVTPGILIELF